MYLGIDIGTSAVKAVVIDDAGDVAAEEAVSLSVSRPHRFWSEQNPADWWAATNEAVTRIDSKVRRHVRAVGLAGQMHGAVVLDGAGQPLRPAILWNDGRAAEFCAELEAREPNSRAISGNIAMAGFTAPKLRWIADREPEVFRAIQHVLLPKDYIRLRMSGDLATDTSDASGTLWLDVGARRWSESLLDACGLTLDQMPRLAEGPEPTGVLRAELAEAWGMGRVPVAAGAGDNAAGAAGVGVTRPGDALMSLGTSGVIFAVTNGFRPNTEGAVHAFCHCFPDVWHQMSVMLSAGASLEWVRLLTGRHSVTDMLAALELAGERPVDEIFLPYLSGERTPHNNPHAQGVFFGLTSETDRDTLVLAVLEGVAMALRDGLDRLEDAGTHLEAISVIGGGARSPLWGAILAGALRLPLIYREGGEVGPSYGAARLARAALGEGSHEQIFKPPAITRVIEPSRAYQDHFAERLPKFRKIYASVAEQFETRSSHD